MDDNYNDYMGDTPLTQFPLPIAEAMRPSIINLPMVIPAKPAWVKVVDGITTAFEIMYKLFYFGAWSLGKLLIYGTAAGFLGLGLVEIVTFFGATFFRDLSIWDLYHCYEGILVFAFGILFIKINK